MRKVLSNITAYIFALFGIAVLGLLMSLTYQALQRIFPTSFANQIWGLVLFDIAAICWALAFIYNSETTQQYAVAAIGFVVAFLGTLGMVAAEVMLSGQQLINADTAQIGQWIIYGFIGTTAIHTALLWGHHFGAAKVHEKINVGIARGEIVTEAIRQATNQLDEHKAQLAATIRNDITARVRRDLGLIEADPLMPFLPKEQTLPALPVLQPIDTPQDEPTPAQIPFPGDYSPRSEAERDTNDSKSGGES